MKRNQTRDIVLMAFYIALFMVLDYLTNMVPFLQMPNGGSLGVSTIALLMASYHLGWKKGFMVALLSVFAQFITGPMYTPDLIGFALDYLFAFSVYGLASLFPNYGLFYTGVLITNVARFVFSTISGVIVWGLDLLPSAAYNFSYMGPTLILGLLLIPVLLKALEPTMKRSVA
ncbi:thiamine transporter [Breznakia sp. PF5-3]|uniref:energy-coupled thiamine transporter ThiT n=1 Tax=unclassified Breznakia TaxID=2623764 RepID=UPI0024059FE6|nr:MULTISPECIES: energy-coupled thiamine transporter ThiT [unclassified Breznakia]MDF9825247.1 thiamine transporter [Breznakia sp. PM6-1]MDF9836111.1 thiamine transporter [Breznakia sp. PF5-3]MDF9838400.1 thiamine transporter [Breznakia sp. PFB2-8]MDF9860416.1 thiamine transporter [Breznakia sp. PH5-24]